MPSPKPQRLPATRKNPGARAGLPATSSRAGRPAAKAATHSSKLPASDDTWRTLSQSAAETDRLGRAMGRALGGGEVLALYGDLGSGKTAFVRGLAAGLGAPPRSVSSPTFVLIHEYSGRLRLIHADLYRIGQESELRHLGLPDYQDGQAVLAVEWADKAGAELPQDRLEVYLAHEDKTKRSIVMKACGPESQACLSRFIARRKPAPRPIQPARREPRRR